MEAMAQRGQAIMQWLLVLGMLAAWSLWDRSPQVVEEARLVVDRALHNSAQLGVSGDVLEKLPRAVSAPLAQYRFEFLRPADAFDSSLSPAKEATLRPLSVGAILTLGKEVAAQIDEHPPQGVTEMLLVTPLRQSVDRLESWQAKSGLSGAASLAEVERELRSSVQIPGTDQKLPLDQCMLFVAVGIVSLQLLLTSLLITLRGLSPPREALDLSWVLLQRAPLGLLLTLTCLMGPPLAWFVQDLLRGAAHNALPSGGTWLLGGILLASTIAVVRQAWLTRRELLLATVMPPATSESRIVPRKAA